MASKIALQLYSVRDLLPVNFEGVIRQVAAMGYQGVETAGFQGTTPKAAAKLFKELELSVAAMHIFPPPTDAKFTEVQDFLHLLECKTIVSGFGPDRYASLDATRQACDELNKAAEPMIAQGIRFLIHNHWWEYLNIEGGYPYKVMLERLDPRIGLEIDTYWVKTGGVDPAKVVKEAGARATLLHIKDGPAEKGVPQVAIGDGTLDFSSILKAGKKFTEWAIVEFDSSATEIMPAIAKSQRYLQKLISSI
jgi:sugar phosphate isomerase/epimerase